MLITVPKGKTSLRSNSFPLKPGTFNSKLSGIRNLSDVTNTVTN
jgi:hypothetical protein